MNETFRQWMPEFYSFVKYWLPLVVIFTMVYKAYTNSKVGITTWADKLMNNHLEHIQAATEKTARLCAEANEEDKKHRESDAAIQQKILTGIEILKDR